MSKAAAISSASEPSTPARQEPCRFSHNRLALIGAGFLAVMITTVIAWPLMLKWAPILGPAGASFSAKSDPDLVTEDQFMPPGPRHWLGTDVHGRDLFSRVMVGARVSLLVGVAGAGVSVLIGALWGGVSGFVGGRLDSAMMRTVDVLYAMPTIIFVIVVMTSLEQAWTKLFSADGSGVSGNWASLVFLLLVLGGISWLTMARIVRGQVLSLRERSFVEASRCLGATTFQILRWHILPNTIGIALVYATLTVPAVILYESFLSYLGLGVQPPMASWGSLLAEGADQLNHFRIYWWLILFPAVSLVSTLLAMTFVGDGLRDAWSPRGE